MASTTPPKGRLLEYVDAEIDSEPLSDEEIAFDEFRNSLGAGEDMGTVRVGRIAATDTRLHSTNAKSVYCFSFPVDRFNFEELCEYIRTNYGGGLYRLIGTKKGTKGSAFNRLIEIAEPLKQKATDGQAPQSLGGIVDVVTNLIAAQEDRTERLLQRLGIGATPAVVAAPDPFAMLEKTLGLVSTMMGAMNAGRPAGGGFVEELEKHAKIADMLGSLGGGGGDRAESNFYDLAGKTLETIGPMVKAALPTIMANAQRPAAPRGRVINQPPAGMQPPAGRPQNTPTQKPATPQGQQGKTMDFAQQVNLLLAQARAGTDPESLADTILQMTPETRIEELRAFISDPALVEKMAAVNPEVRNYADFFGKLKIHVLQMLAEEETGEGLDAPTEEVDDTAAGL